jgi:hypothetical protein
MGVKQAGRRVVNSQGWHAAGKPAWADQLAGQFEKGGRKAVSQAGRQEGT